MNKKIRKGDPAMRNAVEKFADCSARFETGETVSALDGDDKTARFVEIYNLDGSKAARKAYVWQSEHSVGGTPVYKVVLGGPRVTSAQTAVQSTLDSNAKTAALKRAEDD